MATRAATGIDVRALGIGAVLELADADLVPFENRTVLAISTEGATDPACERIVGGAA